MAGHTPLQPLCRLCRRHGSGDAAAKLNGRITSRSKSAGRRIGIYGGCSGRRSRRRSGQCLGRTHSDTEHFQSYSHSAHCRHLPLSAANGKARRPVRPNAAGFCLRSSGAAKHHGLNRADARQSDHSGNLGASSGASLSGGGCRHRLRRPVFLQPSRCRRDGGCHCERSAAGLSCALGRIGCEFRQCALGCSRNSRGIKSGSESAARKFLLSGRRLCCRRSNPLLYSGCGQRFCISRRSGRRRDLISCGLQHCNRCCGALFHSSGSRADRPFGTRVDPNR